MCKYCKDFKTGNCDNQELITGKLDLGPIEAPVIVRVIDDTLSVDVFPSYGDYGYFFEGEVKINYCPMCGTKFEKES